MPDNNAVKLYETKPGWQSSEFWLVLATNLAKSGIEYGEINEALLAAEGEPEPQKIEAEVTIADEKPKPISRRR
jgi:hypothetical protein